MDSALSGVLIVGGSAVLSVIVLLVVRRFSDLDSLRKHHEITGNFFLTLGTLYSVLVAFGIFVVWSGYKDAGTNLQHEASEAADLSRLSTLLPMPLQKNIADALVEYLDGVIHDEFPAMARGRDSKRTWAAMEKLWTAYDTQQVNTPSYQAIYTESLRHLSALSDLRRTRLFTSRGTVPGSLWILLIGGGFLLVCLTYFFGHGNFRSQAVMTAVLTATLSFSLFVIDSLDSPYSGVARHTPLPFVVELDHLTARDSK